MEHIREFGVDVAIESYAFVLLRVSSGSCSEVSHQRKVGRKRGERRRREQR